MIIECDSCRTKFNLSENLLKYEGSKVRCSLCGHVFLAYPPHTSPSEKNFEATVALDSPFLGEEQSEEQKEDGELAFDEFLDESLDENLTASAPATETVEDFGIDESRSESEVDELSEEEVLTESPELGGVHTVTRKSGYSRPLLVILIVLFILAGGIAALVRWAPQVLPNFMGTLSPPKKNSVSDAGIRRLSFKAVTGSFVKAKKAGRLFVIKGIVTNNYLVSRRSVLIKGTVLNEKGVIVRKKVAYAGNALSDEKLHQLSLEELNNSMKSSKGSEVAPDESIPFTIIFEGLPENLSEFTVEAVSSSPVE